MNKSKNIIDKLMKKDYNNVLEEVLSTKQYTEDVKNLLLDILYKIDSSYQDYEKVKVNTLSKDEYIENFINTIKNKCDNINFIKPTIQESEQDLKRVIINKEKKEIICYPILNKLLYAISAIQKKEDIIKSEDELINKALTNMLNVGNNINTVEPLRDFNGFSWNIITSDIENIYCNLIYQSLMILTGNKFLEQWCNKNKTIINYIEQLSIDLGKLYGVKQAEQIVDIMKKLSVLIALDDNSLIVKNINDEKLKIEEELGKITNPEKYLLEISEEKRTLLKKIKKIDMTLNNKELLEKEYKRRNSLLEGKEKIFSAKVLAKKITEERNEAMKRLKICNDLMNPKNIAERKNILERKLKYRKLVDVVNLKDEIYKNLISFEEIIISCIKTKIKKCKSKNELTKIMYQLRYLGFVPVGEKRNVKDITELGTNLNLAKKELIIKANELGITNNILDDYKLNMVIYLHLFSSKIISLENISLKIIKNKDSWYVQFFDDGVTDETFKVELNLKSEDIKIKLNKKIKMFNI